MKDMGVMIPVGKAIVGARLLLGTLLLAAAFVDLSMAEGGLAEATNEQAATKKCTSCNTFWTGFGNSVAMIIATEIGDKTFFIAAIMAMSHPRMAVFGGAIGALAVMTVLSAALGRALPTFLPSRYTHFASAILFLYFGYKMLKEGMESHGGPSEELNEVEEELTKKNDAGAKKVVEEEDLEGGLPDSSTRMISIRKPIVEVVTLSFTMTFLAEWGDRSQIATIALAAAKDPYGVTLGGILGHSLCTGMAVMGGRMLATRISEKTVHLVGGALFLICGFHALIFGE